MLLAEDEKTGDRTLPQLASVKGGRKEGPERILAAASVRGVPECLTTHDGCFFGVMAAAAAVVADGGAVGEQEAPLMP